MSLFRLIREYIAALRAQTVATQEATAVAQRALSDAAWARYQEHRVHGHGGHGDNGSLRHGHGHTHHCTGNASMPGALAD